jgi:A/G-specific adenine glycosylase
MELFHKKIFDFYHLNRRRFPWRETTDRYAVMISEIMLQQTQTERVIPKFEAWLQRFPDIAHLAVAPLRDVLAFWSGLGYNSRAVRLHQCAAIINERYDGVVPSQPELLIQLPGIGEYTSRSIPIFADNGDFAAVDTNIRRIFIHEFALPETISAAKLQEFADAALPCGQSREWHNALMDYGSLHLTSKKSGISPLSRQSKFAGSKRWYRGRLIKELVQSEALSLREIEERYGDCPWNLHDIIGDLVNEGLVERHANAATGALTTLKIKGS